MMGMWASQYMSLLWLARLAESSYSDVYAKELAPYQIYLEPLVISATMTDGKILCGTLCSQTSGCSAFLYGTFDGTDMVDGCYNNNNHFSYTGQRNVTIEGYTCQAWSQTTPHSHPHVTEPENYCRDPDYTGSLWCYTADPSVRWLPCDIPRCYPGTNCRLITGPLPVGNYDHPGFTFYKLQ